MLSPRWPEPTSLSLRSLLAPGSLNAGDPVKTNAAHWQASVCHSLGSNPGREKWYFQILVLVANSYECAVKKRVDDAEVALKLERHRADLFEPRTVNTSKTIHSNDNFDSGHGRCGSGSDFVVVEVTCST